MRAARSCATSSLSDTWSRIQGSGRSRVCVTRPTAEERPSLNPSSYLRCQGDTGAAGPLALLAPAGPAGPSGEIDLVDGNNVTLGRVISSDRSAAIVLTSTGYQISIPFDAAFKPAQIY